MGAVNMKRIIIEAEKCKGCKNCAVACMKAHAPDGVGFSFSDLRFESRNTILHNGQKNYKPLFCRHCDKPKCVTSCVSGAMVKNTETGHVIYDPEKCAQCFMCVMNCPYGVLKPDRLTNTYVVKCDFCTEHGSEPNCVKTCTMKAIYVKEV